jgi:hypothetical protein
MSAFPTEEGRASSKAIAENIKATDTPWAEYTKPNVVVAIFTPHFGERN